MAISSKTLSERRAGAFGVIHGKRWAADPIFAGQK
jgi:hypothetical protein